MRTSNGEFKQSDRVVIASDARVYMAEYSNHRIQRYSVGPWPEILPPSRFRTTILISELHPGVMIAAEYTPRALMTLKKLIS